MSDRLQKPIEATPAAGAASIILFESVYVSVSFFLE